MGGRGAVLGLIAVLLLATTVPRTGVNASVSNSTCGEGCLAGTTIDVESTPTSITYHLTVPSSGCSLSFMAIPFPSCADDGSVNVTSDCDIVQSGISLFSEIISNETAYAKGGVCNTNGLYKVSLSLKECTVRFDFAEYISYSTGTLKMKGGGSSSSCSECTDVLVPTGCITPECGNGVVEPGEECDDGNLFVGDGCSERCVTEVGCCDLGTSEYCDFAEPGRCSAPRGNDTSCDAQPSACCTNQTSGAEVQADTACCDHFGYISGGCPTPVCGNGILEPGEACDDGNLWNLDGCSSTCTLEVSCCSLQTQWSGFCEVDATTCDNVPNSTQIGQCSGILELVSCCIGNETLAFVDPTCCVDAFGGTIGACPVCGNGVLEAGEECDDSNLVDNDGCSSECVLEQSCCSATRNVSGCDFQVPSVCEGFGDVPVNRSIHDCAYAQFGLCCRDNTTQLTGEDTYCCVATGGALGYCNVCGNGIVQSGEACDDGNTDNGDGCSSTCEVETDWECDSANPSNCTLLLGACCSWEVAGSNYTSMCYPNLTATECAQYPNAGFVGVGTECIAAQENIQCCDNGNTLTDGAGTFHGQCCFALQAGAMPRTGNLTCDGLEPCPEDIPANQGACCLDQPGEYDFCDFCSCNLCRNANGTWTQPGVTCNAQPCGCPPLGQSVGRCEYISPDTHELVCVECDCNLCQAFPNATYYGSDTQCPGATTSTTGIPATTTGVVSTTTTTGTGVPPCDGRCSNAQTLSCEETADCGTGNGVCVCHDAIVPCCIRCIGQDILPGADDTPCLTGPMSECYAVGLGTGGVTIPAPHAACPVGTDFSFGHFGLPGNPCSTELCDIVAQVSACGGVFGAALTPEQIAEFNAEAGGSILTDCAVVPALYVPAVNYLDACNQTELCCAPRGECFRESADPTCCALGGGLSIAAVPGVIDCDTGYPAANGTCCFGPADLDTGAIIQDCCEAQGGTYYGTALASCPVCGNGIVEFGEDCDNQLDPFCSDDCQILGACCESCLGPQSVRLNSNCTDYVTANECQSLDGDSLEAVVDACGGECIDVMSGSCFQCLEEWVLTTDGTNIDCAIYCYSTASTASELLVCISKCKPSPLCALACDGDGVCLGGTTPTHGYVPNNDCATIGGFSTCSICGDGVLTPAIEECEDGNTIGGDNCSATCTIEAPGACCLIFVPATTPSAEPYSECIYGPVSELDCIATYANYSDQFPTGFFESQLFVLSQVERFDANTTCEDANCSGPVCGDGVVSVGEQCDDGNIESGDGCGPTCQEEPGWLCSGDFFSTCIQIGACCKVCQEPNGTVTSTIVCQDDVTNMQCTPPPLCPGGSTGFAYFTCNATCPAGDACPAAICGNGFLEFGEPCDDGNTASNDGCSSTCEIEYGKCCVESSGVYSCANNLTLAECAASVPGITDTYHWSNTGLSNATACDTTMACVFAGAQSCFDGVEPDCCVLFGGAILSQCPAVCGNGITENGEECDDGNGSNNDACLNDCTFNVCGDGWVNPTTEQCDDNNTVGADGCSASCTIDDGWACDTASPSFCAIAGCGNGIVEPAEQCDDGNLVSGDGCSALCITEFACCTLNPGTSIDCANHTILVCDALTGLLQGGPLCGNEEPCCVSSVNQYFTDPRCCSAFGGTDGYCLLCGNGVTQPGEACDDGNANNNDACLNDCTLNVCGDGFVYTGIEQCDDGNLNSGDGCSDICTVEPAWNCTGTAPSVCTENTYPCCPINGLGQQIFNGLTCSIETANTCASADGTSLEEVATCGTQLDWCCYNSADYQDVSASCCFNFLGTSGRCNPQCGDGIVDPGEECDDGNTGNGEGCSSTCTVEPGFTCTGTQPSVCTETVGICCPSLGSSLPGPLNCEDTTGSTCDQAFGGTWFAYSGTVNNCGDAGTGACCDYTTEITYTGVNEFCCVRLGNDIGQCVLGLNASDDSTSAGAETDARFDAWTGMLIALLVLSSIAILWALWFTCRMQNALRRMFRRLGSGVQRGGDREPLL